MESDIPKMGIVQLEKECNFLKEKLFSILDQIIADDKIVID